MRSVFLAATWAAALSLVACEAAKDDKKAAFSCDDCSPNADCDKDEATCSCQTGWEGDGKTCTDADECKDGSATCLTGAKCSNTPGSFVCDCSGGYHIVGQECLDINECEEGAGCPANSVCTNTPGFYDCACKPGYSIQPGVGCVDVDECKQNPAPCDPLATCTNTPGSVTCACPAGYTGNGKTCTDIDECQKADTCKPTYVCTNTAGSHTCTCPAGTTDDNEQCAFPGGEVSIAHGQNIFKPGDSNGLVSVSAVIPGNPIANSGAEDGIAGWDSGACGDELWQAVGMEASLGDKAFGGCSCPASLTQLSDLVAKGIAQKDIDAAGELYFYALVRGYGTKAADTIWLEFEAQDKAGKQVKSVALTPETPGQAWTILDAALTGLPAGVQKVKVTLYGQNAEGYAGETTGPLVDGVQVVVGKWQMRTSLDAGKSWTAWIPYSPLSEVKLPSFAGEQTLTVEFQAPSGVRYLASDKVTVQF
jgi:hypothetical protein